MEALDESVEAVRYRTEDAAALRKGDKAALVGERVRVFDEVGGSSGRVGTVRGVKESLGASTRHVIEFDGSSGAPETVAVSYTHLTLPTIYSV